MNGNAPFVCLAIELGIDPNIVVHCLFTAAQCGHLNVIGVLLTTGFNPNITDVSRRSPVWYAASGGHAAVADTLLNVPGSQVGYSYL